MTIASASAALGGLSAPSGADASSALSIQALRSAAAGDPKAASRATAKQLDALLMTQRK
jgi:hypothetical protein